MSEVTGGVGVIDISPGSMCRVQLARPYVICRELKQTMDLHEARLRACIFRWISAISGWGQEKLRASGRDGVIVGRAEFLKSWNSLSAVFVCACDTQ